MQKKEKNYMRPFLTSNLAKEFYNLPRQVFEDAYIPNGYIDIVKTDIFKNKNILHGENIYLFETEVTADIDIIEDFHFANSILHEKKFADILNYLKDKLEIQEGKTSTDGLFTLELTSCLGVCAAAPVIMVNDKIYGNLDVKKLDQIIDKCKRGEIEIKEPTSLGADILGNKEDRVVLENCGIINPELIEDYKLKGGYTALSKAIKEMTPQKVINEVKNSKLVGRGGAAFPTGLKWEFSSSATKKPKYIICNADEGEPGTFKDREILTRVPHKVLSGMAMGAKIIGAQKGYIYLRGGYKFLVPDLKKELRKFHDILDELGLDFRVEIFLGSGAYICGEESALIESMEGKRGEPRNKPPFPSVNGFKGKPTVVNNVETLAHSYTILKFGAKKFRDLGVKVSCGYKVFSVSGVTPIPGIYEL